MPVAFAEVTGQLAAIRPPQSLTIAMCLSASKVFIGQLHEATHGHPHREGWSARRAVAIGLKLDDEPSHEPKTTRRADPPNP